MRIPTPEEVKHKPRISIGLECIRIYYSIYGNGRIKCYRVFYVSTAIDVAKEIYNIYYK